jgi:beta-glucoside operon transcriptional antiterminator
VNIAKVLNNNIAIAVNDDGEDVIVMGCGVAFQKKHGDEIDESKIEHIFTKSIPELRNKFEALVKDIPPDYLEAADYIINNAKLHLGKELTNNLYLSLTDHIYFAAMRFKEGLNIHNRLLLETKMLYKEEFEVGLESIEYLNKKFSIDLPEDEAAFLALHFVNASIGMQMNETMEITRIVQQIRAIIRNYFRIEFNEDSLDYYRLMTHLKFFAQRMVMKKSHKSGCEDLKLLQMVKENYQSSYKCMECITKFLKKTYDYSITSSEQLYLTIHIGRIQIESDSK